MAQYSCIECLAGQKLGRHSSTYQSKTRVGIGAPTVINFVSNALNPQTVAYLMLALGFVAVLFGLCAALTRNMYECAAINGIAGASLFIASSTIFAHNAGVKPFTLDGFFMSADTATEGVLLMGLVVAVGSGLAFLVVALYETFAGHNSESFRSTVITWLRGPIVEDAAAHSNQPTFTFTLATQPATGAPQFGPWPGPAFVPPSLATSGIAGAFASRSWDTLDSNRRRVPTPA